jgi:hypothetical protein
MALHRKEEDPNLMITGRLAAHSTVKVDTVDFGDVDGVNGWSLNAPNSPGGLSKKDAESSLHNPPSITLH